MSAPALRHAGKPRRVLIALALLFFAPVVVAFILYYGIGWSPGRRLNYGELVEPPVPLPDLVLPQADGPHPDAAGGPAPASTSPVDVPRGNAPGSFLKGKWTLVYVGAGSCSAGCRTDLYNTRQVRAALDRKSVV